MADFARVVNALAAERAYQDTEYGTTAERNLSIGDYLVIARGEMEEAEEAFRDGSNADTLCEIMQAAAVLVACMERHGIGSRA